MLSKERVTDNLLYRLEDAGGFAVTNARFAALHGLPVALWPFDDARSTTQIRALVTSGHLPECRNCGGLPSAARWRDVSLRLRFARRFSPSFAPLSPLTNRRPKPKLQRRQAHVLPIPINKNTIWH